MEITEGRLTFSFPEGVAGVKFDDTGFYRNRFNKLPGGKGVDALADCKSHLLLLEIKDCAGHESENTWRISPNNAHIALAPTNASGVPRESFDFEVAKKVASTISCLYGAWTKSQMIASTEELVPFWKGATKNSIPKNDKRFLVILYLDGDFGCKTRSKKMIMAALQHSIEDKLSWLECAVSVVDSSTYPHQFFDVKST